MPSEHQKKRAAKKKEAAKAKGGKKLDKEDAGTVATNGTSNGSISDKLKEMQPDQIDASNLTYEEELCRKLEEEARLSAEARSCTGVLGIHPMARDIKIDNFSVTFYGSELLQDTKLELSTGNRYGLIGANGCGKSALLAVLGNREVPIQEHIDIYYLDREVPASEKTAIQAVMEADEERIKLEKLAEELATIEDNEAQEYLMQVYERLDDLGADSAEARASHLLSGLQFTAAMQNKKCKDFFGQSAVYPASSPSAGRADQPS